MTDEIKAINLNPEIESKKEEKIKVASKASKGKLFISATLVILLGSLSGFGLSRLKQSATYPKKLKTSTAEGIKKGDSFGVQDEKVFRDSAEGKLVAGGIDGEGSHHLVREGGKSQNVYLTSSVIDLDKFVDRKVKVWGETFEAQLAGWLMDVGRLEILE